ncbi:MAG: RluA family pseudouridine synthase [Candidatus Binatia bacterium]
MREIVLGINESGKKLENYLKKEFPIGYIRKLFRKHGIRLNGQRAKPADALRAGDKIQLYIPFDKQGSRTPPRVVAPKLDIVFEDSNLLVVDKPAGLAVHEGKTVSKRDSVLGILQRQYRESQAKPQLVHRLDQDTSGLLLVAKNPKTAEEIEQAFETGAVGKEYLALVVGRLAHNHGVIDTPLPGRDGNPVRALTRYWVVKRYSEVTLVRVAIETGRLHQIRLHFAHLGHPVVMDDQHGDFAFNKQFRKEYGLKRQFLHAQKLCLNLAGKVCQWQAKLPKDLDRTLASLSKQNL